VKANLSILITAIFVASAFGLAGSSARQAQAEGWTEEALEMAERRTQEALEKAQRLAEEAEERSKEAEASAEDAEGANGGPVEAVLRIEGEPGTEFSGHCAVGSERDALGGQVPQTVVYKFAGANLECEIRQQSEGVLKVVLEAGNDRVVQRISSPGGTVRFTYSGNAVSSTTVSSSSSSSISQTGSSVSPPSRVVSSSSQTQVVVSSE